MRVSSKIGPRRLIAGASVAALSASALALAPQALAAETTVVQVTAGDIAADAEPYAGWHQGQAGAVDRHAVTADGLSLIGKSQVIKGYENNSKDVAVKNADLDDVLPEVEYTVSAGTLWLQVPVFYPSASAADGIGFTTLRPATRADQGANDVELTDEWLSTGAIGDTIVKNRPYPLGQILDALGDDYKTLAFGVFTDTNMTGSVKDLTWDGTKYDFVPSAPTSATVTDSDVAPDATTYAGWHQGYDNAALRHQVTAAGLELAGNSQVIHGYANNAQDVDVKNAVLPFAVRNASYTVVEGAVNFQLPVYFDNGSGVQFATLRQATQQGPGTHTIALDDEWISSRALGSIPANARRPLSDLIAGLGSYKVLAFGVHQASPGSATVSDITWEGTKHVFTRAAGQTEAVTVTEGDIRPDDSAYAGWHQGYPNAAGNHRVTTPGGLELTGPSQVIKGYENNANDVATKNVDLRRALGSASYTVTEGDAWLQVPVFFSSEASAGTSFATLRPYDPAKPGTNVIDLDDRWIATKAVGTVPANTAAPLRELLGQMTAYKVLAFGVLSDKGGSAKVSDITWDGTTYSFVNHAPTLPDRNLVTRVGVPVSVDLGASDRDGNAVTLATTTAGASISGQVLSVTVPNNSRATRNVTVTATDDRGATSTARISVKVNKAFSGIRLASPRRAKAGKRINVKVVVSSTARVKNSRVDLFIGGKKVGTARVNAAGRATIRTSKLAKGNQKVVARLRATSFAAAKTSNVRKIRVR